MRFSNLLLIPAVIGAIVLVALCGALLLHALPPDPTPQAHKTSLTTMVPTATDVPPTAQPSPTPTLSKPTATPVRHPLPVPTNPPPPAHNTLPPVPTPTPIPPPTATPVGSAKTPTACPGGASGCATPTLLGTATATPIPLGTAIATPGPCQPNGAKYYVTPTTTPTTATIDQAITSAATRNSIPPLLEKAIAWQESGWQQNIGACDGGVGLMQLMPSTVAWINAYYHVSDDPKNIDQNAGLGAGYILYFYNYYIGYLQQNDPTSCGSAGCNWDTPWPGATDGANVRDIVISVYNEGAGTMSQSGITNWWYVNDVLAYMSGLPWAR